MCGPGGCTCLVPGGVPARGVVPGGCTCLVPRGGVVLGGYLPGLGAGVYLVLGGVPGQVLLPLWTEFLTHTSEIITLPETSFVGGN